MLIVWVKNETSWSGSTRLTKESKGLKKYAQSVRIRSNMMIDTFMSERNQPLLFSNISNGSWFLQIDLVAVYN